MYLRIGKVLDVEINSSLPHSDVGNVESALNYFTNSIKFRFRPYLEICFGEVSDGNEIRNFRIELITASRLHPLQVDVDAFSPHVYAFKGPFIWDPNLEAM